MRLSQNQISAILKAKESFFPYSKIYLFGSRIDDSRCGGDIDLYILSEKRVLNGVKKRIDFLVMLKSLIGDQKIDVILHTGINLTFLIRLVGKKKTLPTLQKAHLKKFNLCPRAVYFSRSIPKSIN
jgi:predicted nucleotidyltransferase